MHSEKKGGALLISGGKNIMIEYAGSKQRKEWLYRSLEKTKKKINLSSFPSKEGNEILTGGRLLNGGK